MEVILISHYFTVNERTQSLMHLSTALPVQSRGKPPYMLELDTKLIRFLRAVRSKGGVINIHVVRATAEALIKSNPSLVHQFISLEMSRSWVQSIYRRMGLSRRLGYDRTTSSTKRNL